MQASPLTAAAFGTSLAVNELGMARPSPGMIVQVAVTVRNGSPVDLAGSEECPVTLSYRMVDPASGKVIVSDGLRTAFGPVLRSGEQRTLVGRVQIPHHTGLVVLRMSLVHELNFWFCDVAPGSAADVSVTIADKEGWTEPANAPGVFAPHKCLNNRHAARFIRFDGRFRPLMLVCETTNICNNHCIICAYDSQTRKKQRMSLDVFRETIRQYEDIGGGGLSLTPMVGDVFLDRALPERLEIIAEKRDVVRRLSITTNAAYVKLYSDNELGLLLSHFDHIQISVYGIDAEEFSAMTKTSGYELMRVGIERIVRFSRGTITLGFRCLKARSPAEIQNWVESIPGFDRASKRVRFHGSMRQYANWGLFDTSRPLPFGAEWIAPTSGEKDQCGIPLLAMQVFSNGNVSFCPCDDFDNNEELHLGNVMETTLSEMFNSPKARKLWDWKAHGTPTFCKACSFHRPLVDLIETPNLFEDPLVVVGG